MTDETPDAPARRLRLSREPVTAWVILAIGLPLGGWLAWEVHRTIGLGEPHFWRLLRDDRLFGLAMLDFFLTAGWAALVILERAGARDWRLWVSLALFLPAPSLGIAAFILLERTRPRPSGRDPVAGPRPT